MLAVLRECFHQCVAVSITNDANRGWSIYTSAFAGETPCVSSLPLPLVPSATIASPGISASAITNQIFTFKYALAAKHSKTLSPGAIAGTAIGSIAAIALTLATITLLIRRRHAKARTKRETATVCRSETTVKGRSELDPGTTHDNKGISELPSPHSQDTKGVSELPSPQSPELLERPFWSFRLPTSPSELANNVMHEMPAAPPAEMEGSTYIDEHHPLGRSDDSVEGAEDRVKRQGRIMEQVKEVG